MAELQHPAQYPAKLVISSREFYDKFVRSFDFLPNKIDPWDARETLTQLIECLSMYGRHHLATLDFGQLPQLDRMKNPPAPHELMQIATWKGATKVMADELILYLEQSALFNEEGKFDYLLVNVIENMLMFDYIPF